MRRKLDQRQVDLVYRQHGDALNRFLLGVLRDPAAAADALQSTFARLLERGHEVERGALRAWLFRVAFNEAMQIRRRLAVEGRANEQMGWMTAAAEVDAVEIALQAERIEQMQVAMNSLPNEQRQIVVMRIYEGYKFAEIAGRLQLPLGTVLTRMQAGLKKLRRWFETHDV